MDNRSHILNELIFYTQPIELLVSALKQFPWDADEPFVVLSLEHIKNTLLRYLQGELTGDQVEDWANAIEGREDIDFEAGHEELLREIIHQLANPLLTVALDSESAHQILWNLK